MPENRHYFAEHQVLELSVSEHQNLQANCNSLGLWDFVNNFFRVFETFSLLIQRPTRARDNPDEFLAVMNSVQLMQHDMIKSVLCICRGYITDSSFSARRVIESSASIVHLLKHPDNVKIWMSVTEDDGIGPYVKAFPVFKLVKENLNQQLRDQYEYLCLLVHPSALSMSPRVLNGGWKASNRIL